MKEEPEEVRRLVEAIAAFEAMTDDTKCAVAVTEAMEKLPELHGQLREVRQQRVQRLRDSGKTWKEIGILLGGISAARAQQIGVGLRGAKRPPKKDEAQPPE